MALAAIRCASWLAILTASWTLGVACSLNPQPLPPEQGSGAQNGAEGGLGSGSGSHSPTGPGSSSGSGIGLLTDSGPAAGDATLPPGVGGFPGGGGLGGGSSGGSSSGGGTPAADGAGGTPPDGSSDGGSVVEDATPDAPAPSDAAMDGPSASDGGCITRWDCRASFPDTCNACAWPLNHLVCVRGECVCACRVADAAGE
jgi:hypothetical protein